MAVKGHSRLLVGAMSITLLGGLSACGQAGTQPARTQHAGAAVSASELDAYRPDDLKFFGKVRAGVGQALWPAPPKDIEEAKTWSTVTLVAEVVDVRRTRTFPDDNLQMVGIVLKPAEILTGKLRPELDEVIVERPMSPPGDGSASGDPVADLKASLPKGKAVWFLMWQGAPRPGITPKAGAPARPAGVEKYYALSDHGAVFMQGSNSVISAMADPEEEAGRPGNTMAKDASSFDKLSSLVAEVRKMK